MLKIQHNKDEIEVRFDHKFCGPNEINTISGFHVDCDRRCSLATVILNGKVVSRGLSVCNPVDNFCRSIGRKRALGYALQSSCMDKQKRTAIWQQYEKTCGF